MDSKTKKPRGGKAEERELERSYSKITGKKAKAVPPAKKNITVICVCVACVVVLVGILTCVFFFLQAKNAVIPSNLTVAGVYVGGMSAKEAENAVRKGVGNAYETTTMTVTMLDKSVDISPAVSGAKLDVSAAVSAAMKYGKKGLFGKAEAPAQKTAVDISGCLSLDKDAIQKQLNGLAFNFNSALTQTTCEVTGEMPADQEDTSKQMVLTIHKGTPEYSLDLDKLYRDVADAYSRRDFTPTVECPRTEPKEPDLFALYSKYCKDPVDAAIDPKTFQVTGETYGYGFNIEDVYKKLAETPYGETLTVPFTFLPPKIKGSDLSDTLYQDVLGSYTTTAESGNDANLQAAAKLLDQVIVYPGETFSFNRKTGQPSAENGFRMAQNCNGNGEFSLGGGICTISGCLYYCALQADLEITEHHFHNYAQPDMTMGLDAHVCWGSDDLQFKNNTGAPIRIEISVSATKVSAALMGSDTKDYTITPKAETRSTVQYGVSYQSLPSDNGHGFRDGDVIQKPAAGCTVLRYLERTGKASGSAAEKIDTETVTYAPKEKILCSILD